MTMDIVLANINSLVEIMIFLITGVIGLYTFRVHQFTQERKHKLLGISFILIGLSYLVKVGSNFGFNNGFITDELIFSYLRLLYSAFLLFGYTVLDKLFLNIKSYKVFSLQLILFGLTLFLVNSVSFLFLDLVSFFLMFYPVMYFFENYSKKKRKHGSLRVLIAFSALMISHASFFLIFINNSLFFVDNLIRLGAYAILLSHYVLVNK